jgi:hypothetical protein
MANLIPPKGPNLLIAPPAEYESKYQEQLNNALRLYFNTIDNGFAALLANTGGSYLNLPHIGASDSTDQYAGGNNTATIVKWNTLDQGTGFTLNVDNTATSLVNAIYKIDYSLQFANTANAAHDAVVWLQLTRAGVTTQVANSASKITIPARKSAGVPSYILMYSTVVFEMEIGDKVGLWWATDLAYNPVGPVDGVYMEYLPAQTSPYAHPAIPSAIGAITFVSSPTT